MKSEDKIKEVDINEVAIALEVDSDVIDKVRSGEVTHIVLQINEQNALMVTWFWLSTICQQPIMVAIFIMVVCFHTP